MKANHPSPSTEGVPPNTPDLDHETRYAIEVLQKEFPQRSPDLIARELAAAREKAGPSADRWQILAHARAQLSNR